MNKPLATFLALTFTLSWAYWLSMLAMGLQVGPGLTTSHLPGLAGPALAALVTAALFQGHSGLLALFRASLRWPSRPLTVLALIVSPPLLSLLILALRGPLPPLSDWLAYPGLPAGLAPLSGIALALVLNGWGEELGWRGYLFPLLSQRQSDLMAALVLSAIWALWHLPLFWLNQSMQSLWGPMLLGWALGLTAGAFVLTHLWKLSGHSVLATALWHVSYNYAVATPATQGLPAALVSSLVMIWGLGVALYWARSGQRR